MIENKFTLSYAKYLAILSDINIPKPYPADFSDIGC